MLLQTLKGVRVALLIGGFSSLIVIPLALLFGMSAGYFGRRIDDAVFFVITTLSSIPTLLLLIALVMALGRGTVQVCIALGVTSWVGFARVMRGETLKLRELDYVAAARALGAGHARILTPPRAAQPDASGRHHLRAAVLAPGALRSGALLAAASASTAAGGR